MICNKKSVDNKRKSFGFFMIGKCDRNKIFFNGGIYYDGKDLFCSSKLCLSSLTLRCVLQGTMRITQGSALDINNSKRLRFKARSH